LNVLAGLALADALEVSPPRAAAAAIASTAPVPGRFEVIPSDHSFDVVVDYGHNPDGVLRALETGRDLADARGPDASLRVVLSAPRIRNEEQRAMVGRIGASMADHLVLTNERRPETDSATELPTGFASAALEQPRGRCEVVLDRSDAIERALRAARPGDLVMIVGRGMLSGILLDRFGQPRPFDDREMARRLLARIPVSRSRPLTLNRTDE
jgi:UDP-N-acetylmuramoyl-L-alanyl-D-glutamate--2,6-diaminopimelate ligase